MAKRVKRTLKEEEKKMFLSLDSNAITLTLLNDLFADKTNITDGKYEIVSSKFNTFDEFTLNPGEYFNKERITTNCGLFIFNKYLIEPYFQKEVGYVNFEITKKGLGKIDAMVAEAIMLDDTGEEVKKYIEYLNRLCWLAFTFNTQICSSISVRTAKPLPQVTALKKQLLKENKEAIENDDAVTYTKIQDALVKKAQEELKDDPSMELYTSGARGSFDNAYRQWLCTKGPVWNASKKKFEIVTNSLYEGVPRENIPSFANAVVSGFYPKAIGTGECGYITKKLAAAFQSVTLDERGSDCKTPHTASVELSSDNLKYYLYHFIKENNGTYTRLEPSNSSKYLGKTIKFRVPEYCIGKKLCNRCAGDRYYLMGIQNIGLTFGRVSNSLLRGKMKKSHDSTVRTYKLDPKKLFL